MRHSRPDPELPALDDGVTLLRTEERAGPLCALVVDHLLRSDGAVYWVDAGGHARTDHLARVAPSERLLDRLRLARGFTAHQHHALVDRLAETGADLFVLPAVDRPYHEETGYGDRIGLLESVANRLGPLSRAVPVLLTLTAHDDLTAPVANVVDRTVHHESTAFGPRFAGPGFETLVYPHGDGTVQTTLAFWARVLERRAVATTPEVLARGAY
jgi:hypothetical protein